MASKQESYCDRAAGAVQARVRVRDVDAILGALTRRQGCVPVDAAGRGGLLAFPLSGGDEGLLRPCRRGGVLRKLLGDRYLLRNRPLAEFEAHRAVLALGVPAPELLGVSWERQGLFYRGALATIRAGGMDLQDWLVAHAGSEQAAARQAQMAVVGAAVARMHAAGAWHADLQVKNLLVAPSGAVMVLDFDRARVGRDPGEVAKARNLLRFRRSLRKRGWPDNLFQAFLTGYGPVRIPGWLDMLYRIRGRMSAFLGMTKASP